MKRNKTKVIILALVVTLLLLATVAFSACQQNKEEDKLYVGMECGYAPFNYTQTDNSNGAVKISNADGYANGYDVMIAKKIAEQLDKELVIVKYEWDALVNGVVTEALDFIIAGMSPTAERRESIDFSNPYYESQLVIVVRKDGNFANANSLDDFDGAKVVAQLGTFHDKALEEQGAQHGIIRQTPMESFPAMINALNTKAIDGYVAEEPGAIADCTANTNFTYVKLVNNVTGFTASAEDVQIAIGLSKNSPYTEKVNIALAGISTEDRQQMMQLAISFSEETTTNFWQQMADIFTKYSGWLLKGVGYTMLVALVGTIVGLLLGILIGTYRTIPAPQNKFLRVLKTIGDWILSAYVEIFRGTPMMVQAMVIFWGYALVNNGNTMNVIVAGLIIVSINTGAYMAEIVRGGIISIDKGQFEGAYAIGMTHSQTMWRVVIPQSLRNILPSVSNEFVINIKDTSVLNVIGFTELFFQAKTIVTMTANTFATYLAVAVIYFVLTFAITRILRFVEKKMDGKKNYTIQGAGSLDANSYAKAQQVGGNGNV